jgi:probable HAF family extracellular repeat protein
LGGGGYRITDAGPNGSRAVAYDLNESGVVAGGSSGVDHASRGAEGAYLWERGVITPLAGRAARAVNDLGEVVGEAAGAPCRWGADEPSCAGASGVARGVNNLGQVVGELTIGNGKLHAFLWEGFELTDLGTLGGDWSVAYDISDSGQVVGWAENSAGQISAFSWNNGVMTDLGSLGGPMSMAYAVNDNGDVVGFSSTPDGDDRAFIARPDEGLLDLGSLGGYSVAYDVDNYGRVVGEAATEAGQVVGQGSFAGQLRPWVLTPAGK